MKQQDLNEYILHYLTEDKTRSAIMLTAPWGTGKSYYIQNNLIPYIQKQGDYKCVVVSLYGLTDLIEISRNIYLELRTKRVTNFLKDKLSNVFPEKIIKGSKEVGSFGVGHGKTIIKGLAGKIGIDLSISDKDLAKVFNSIDLTDKLVIIEDLERSGIDILKVLGYVNNLVDQDGVKVLLVANEEELIEYKPLVIDDPNKRESVELHDKITNHKDREYTESTKIYLKTKEKTISDTIVFTFDNKTAIKNIITGFGNELLNHFILDDGVNDIIELCNLTSVNNLRTFIFACQKTVDLYNKIDLDSHKDNELIKTIFYSIIAFSQKFKSGERVYWKNGENFSMDLSLPEYPLFRFCYDYITKHSFKNEDIELSKNDLKLLKLYDKEKSRSDHDIRVLNSWWINSEKDVRNSVESITKRLEVEDDISFYQYGDLAANLVRIKDIIGCDIDKAKELLVKNLYDKGDVLKPEFIITHFMSSEPLEVIKEYNQLVSEMKESLKAMDTEVFGFDYGPKNIPAFCGKISARRGEVLDTGAFASRLNMEKICDMLKNCTPAELHAFRLSFLEMYRTSNIKDFLPNDKEALEELLSIVQSLKGFKEYDNIQIMQIEYFEGNLKSILERY